MLQLAEQGITAAATGRLGTTIRSANAMKIVLASNNRGKLTELQALLADLQGWS